MESASTYQEILKSRMRKSNINQRQVARLSGINYVTVNRILSGKYKFSPTTDTLSRITRVIGSTPEEYEAVMGLVNSSRSHRYQVGDSVRDIYESNKSRIGRIARLWFTYEVEFPEGKRILYQEERLIRC